MTGNKVYLVKNLGHKACKVCGSDHTYLSRSSHHARCGTPVGLSEQAAIDSAKTMGLDPEEAVIVVPDDTVIVLDDSARKLKQQGGGTVPLDQVFLGLRTV